MIDIEKELKTVENNIKQLYEKSDVIQRIADVWIEALNNGHKIIFCGNGGSSTDSQHLSAELMGKYKLEREPLPSMSLAAEMSALTAICNDYSYDQVFSRQLKGLGNKGDVVVGLSTSGNSKNVIEAFRVAKEKGIKTVAFTGKNGGELVKYADIILNVPSDITNNIQEMHIVAGHLICGIVEEYFFNKKE